MKLEIRKHIRYLFKKLAFEWKKIFWSECIYQTGQPGKSGVFPPIGSTYKFGDEEYVITEYVHEKGIFYPFDYWEVWGYQKWYDGAYWYQE